MKRRRKREEEKTIHGNSGSLQTFFGERKPCCFFKLILSPSSQSKKLRIPEKFARAFYHELSTAIILKLPTGETRKVGLLKEENKNKLWFHYGWQEFMEYFSIQYAFFLLFKYEGNSNFRVHIFNPTGCEISYATSELKQQTCPVKIHNNLSNNSPKIMNSSLINPNNNGLEVTQLDNDADADDDRTKMLNSSPENNGARKGTLFGGSSRVEKKERLMKAVVVAGISLPERPFFVTLIKPYVLHKGLFLTVPVPFSRDHLSCKAVDSKLIKLEGYDGKQWSVRCKNFSSKCIFSTGWIIFAREVGLEVGDACVFELTDAKNCVLKVHIAKRSKIEQPF